MQSAEKRQFAYMVVLCCFYNSSLYCFVNALAKLYKEQDCRKKFNREAFVLKIIHYSLFIIHYSLFLLFILIEAIVDQLH